MKLHIKIPALEYQSAITSDIALPTKNEAVSKQ